MAQEVQRGQFKLFDAAAYRVGIVVAQFNRDITEGLLQAALKKLEEYRVPQKNIRIERVAGSVEIPVILRHLAGSRKYDCLIALGLVMRGETPHFDYVAKIVTEGVLDVMMRSGLPVGFGILTTENYEQASSRLHVGAEAAEAALQNGRIIEAFSNAATLV